MKLARITRLALGITAVVGTVLAAPGSATASEARPAGYPFPNLCTQWTSSDIAIGPGSTLTSGTSECAGNFELANQGDGNLVIYNDTATAIWASNTDIHAATTDVMQNDGNFVVYNGSGQALWATGTYEHAGAHLCFQTDGNLVVYASGSGCSGTALWASGT